MGGQLRSIAVLYELLAVVALAVALVRITERTRIPYPVFLVLEGIVWGLLRRELSLPFIPVPPDVIFVALIPPLLVSAAFDVPARQLKVNAAPIGSLAVGLVVASTLVVGALVRALVPGMSFAAGCVIGAIVAPPDPIAASSVVRELGVPSRLALVLEGEGLLNDATAITVFRIALVAALAGTIGFGAGAWLLTRAIVFGVAAGALIAWLTTLALRHIDEPMLEVVVSWCGAYASYAGAEAISGSGILACLTAGLWMRERLQSVSSPRSRLSRRAAWNALVFVIEVVVFTLIGREFAALLTEHLPGRVWISAIWVCVAVIVLRVAWVFTVPYAMRLLPERVRGAPMSARERLMIGWAGMRGVISLAMVLSLPRGQHGLPERTAMIAITLLVIFATLLLQGVSLPWVIRWLGLSRTGEAKAELEETRALAARAALERLRSVAPGDGVPDDLVHFVRETYERRLAETDEERSAAFRRLREATLQAEREVVRERWSAGVLTSEGVEQLEHEIDVQEITLGGLHPPPK